MFIKAFLTHHLLLSVSHRNLQWQTKTSWEMLSSALVCLLLSPWGNWWQDTHSTRSTHTHTAHAGQGMGYECKSSWLCWLLNPLWSRLNENATHNFDTNETCHFACQLTVCPLPFDSPLPPPSPCSPSAFSSCNGISNFIKRSDKKLLRQILKQATILWPQTSQVANNALASAAAEQQLDREWVRQWEGGGGTVWVRDRVRNRKRVIEKDYK